MFFLSCVALVLNLEVHNKTIFILVEECLCGNLAANDKQEDLKKQN